MLRSTSYVIVFLFAFVLGLLFAPTVSPSLNEQPDAPAPYLVNVHHDFFGSATQNNATKPVKTAQTKELTTFCNDRKILPIWKALFRDGASREVLEYSNNARDCRDILEIYHVDLNGDRRSEVLVRAVTLPSCGAVGNCDFWVLEKRSGRYRIILHGDDYWDITEMGKQMLHQKTNGYRDILLKGHFSAAETRYVTYRFNGKRYVVSRCRYQVHDHANSTAKKPKWHFVSCKQFESRVAS